MPGTHQCSSSLGYAMAHPQTPPSSSSFWTRTPNRAGTLSHRRREAKKPIRSIPANPGSIESESAYQLAHAPMHKIMEYYFRYMTERPEKMIQYANSILSVFEKTPQPHVLRMRICEPMSNVIQTFSPFWKVFFYYFLTYFGFPTRKSRLIQDFLRSFIIHPTASLDFSDD